MNKLFFSFPIFSNALASRILKHKGLNGFVVGITGPWGSGKTTLMENTIEKIGESHISFVFNAWAHSKQDVVWRSFFVAVVSTLQRELEKEYPLDEEGNRSEKGKIIEKLLNESEQALYTAFTTETPGEIEINAGNVAKNGAKLALKFIPWGDSLTGVTNWFLKKEKEESSDDDDDPSLSASDINDLWGVFKRSVVKQKILKIESMEQFRKTMEEVLKQFISPEKKLIVIIDDVDRCLPEQGLEIFEAIKLFLDLPNTVFLVGMDQEVLQHALDLRYKYKTGETRRITAELYSEKMIDLLFPIPSPTTSSFKAFVKDELPLGDMISNNFDLISTGLPSNPRTWNRFANRAAFRYEIIQMLYEDNSDFSLDTPNSQAAFLKLEVLWFRWPQIMRLLGNLDNYLKLEKIVFEAMTKSSDFHAELMSGKSIEEILGRNTTEDITMLGGVSGELSDLSLIQFISNKPELSKETDILNYLNSLFTLDKNEE